MNDEKILTVDSNEAGSVVNKKQSLRWRTVLAAAAVIILVALVYSYLQEQSNSAIAVTTTTVSPIAPEQLTFPEATAHANPDSAQAQFDLGNAYVEAGRWEQAQIAYQKAIELDPNYQAGYANLGVVYYQLGKLDLAALQYQKALELNPNDGEVAYNLGALYVQQALLNSNPPNQDLLNKAVVQLKHSLELNPGLVEPYFSLGVAYNALSQKAESIQAFETFLSRDSGHDPRAGQEAKRYLETLRKQ